MDLKNAFVLSTMSTCGGRQTRHVGARGCAERKISTQKSPVRICGTEWRACLGLRFVREVLQVQPVHKDFPIAPTCDGHACARPVAFAKEVCV
jgi:hypothetical protein